MLWVMQVMVDTSLLDPYFYFLESREETTFIVFASLVTNLNTPILIQFVRKAFERISAIPSAKSSYMYIKMAWLVVVNDFESGGAA